MKIVNVHAHAPDGHQLTVLQSDGLTINEAGQLHSAGIHPLKEIPDAAEEIARLEKALQHPACIAIGESGLDKASPLTTEMQQQLFREQMKLSEIHGLPVIIHCVGRWNELELLLKERKPDAPEWIIHGFRKAKLADKFLSLGANLSFGKALLYDEHLHALIPSIPVEKLFLETDDEVFDILLLYEKLAELRCESVEAVAEQLYRNFRRVFPKAEHEINIKL